MDTNVRKTLNNLYLSLDNKREEILSGLKSIQEEIHFKCGFYNGHYHKNDRSEYEKDYYPIPVVSIVGLCDIEIDFDNISITSKLKKNNIIDFEFIQFTQYRFEVYGVEDYLCDFGTEKSLNDMIKKIIESDESEFFITFYLPFNANVVDVLNLIKLFQTNSFFY
ncbi:MAG: hypothetical protein WAP91_01015 [Bacilli bacterium]